MHAICLLPGILAVTREHFALNCVAANEVDCWYVLIAKLHHLRLEGSSTTGTLLQTHMLELFERQRGEVGLEFSSWVLYYRASRAHEVLGLRQQ